MFPNSKINPIFLALVLCFSWISHSEGQTFLGKKKSHWVKGLSSGNAKIRVNSAFALGMVGKEAAPEVFTLLKYVEKDTDPSVRNAAAFAIGEILEANNGKVQDADLLEEALQDVLEIEKEPLVRRSAIYCLGALGKTAVNSMKYMDKALADKHPAVRQTAAWALGRVGPSAVNSLRKALKDEDPIVRREAAIAVGGLGIDAHPAVPELLTCLEHENPEVKRAGLLALVRLVDSTDKAAIEPLKKFLEDEDITIRRNAALAMGNIGGEGAAPAVPVLTNALLTAEIKMKRQAAAALANIGPSAESAVPFLQKALKSKDKSLRNNAAVALGGIGEKAQPAVPDLVRLLADQKENPVVRQEAAVALRHLGVCQAAVDAIPTLIEVFTNPKNPPDVRAQTLWAFRVHQEKLADYPKFFEALDKTLATEPAKLENKMLRYDCAFILGMFKQDKVKDKVMATLLEFLKDDTIIIYAGTQSSVSGGGGEKGVGDSSVAKRGKDDGRKMVIQALERIGVEKVRQYPKIVEQVKFLSESPKTLPNLKKLSMEFAKRLDDK